MYFMSQDKRPTYAALWPHADWINIRATVSDLNRGDTKHLKLYDAGTGTIRAPLGVLVMFRNVYVEFWKPPGHVTSASVFSSERRLGRPLQRIFRDKWSRAMPGYLIIFPTTCKRMRVLAFNVQSLRPRRRQFSLYTSLVAVGKVKRRCLPCPG
jgi:hypothetical protein